MINILSKHFQSETGTLAESTNIINGTIKSLEEKRNENVFARLWLQIEELAKKNDIRLDIRSSKRKKSGNVRLKEYVVEAKTSAAEGFQEILEVITRVISWKFCSKVLANNSILSIIGYYHKSYENKIFA